MLEKTFIIGGMSCAACSASVERVTRRIDGVETANVNLTTAKLTVYFDGNIETEEKIKSAVLKAGFTITDEIKTQDKEQVRLSKTPIILAFILCSLLLYISMGHMLIDNLPLPSIINPNTNPFNFAISQLVLTVPILIIGRNFFINGFKSLFLLHPNMDSLVAIGSSASFMYSLYLTFFVSTHNIAHELYYESSAVVLTFIMLGKFLESRNKEKTKETIKKLMNLSPDTTTIIIDNIEKQIKTTELKINDIVLIKPGEKIPTDCVVINGESDVDESMLTGESLPDHKTPESLLTGGTLNIDGVLYAKVTHIGEDTTLQKIIKIVEDAQGKKAPIAKIADKVAGVFVPIVILISIITAIVWLIFSEDKSLAIKTFVSVLVIACPCSLGLATPTAIMVGTGLGASNGILIKSGEALQKANNVNTIIFDKTGTLTKGKMVVEDVVCNIEKQEFLNIVSSIESLSNHPIAKAICEYVNSQEIIEFSEYQNISGKGIFATYNEDKYYCGNKRLLEENGISTKAFETQAEKMLTQGKTIIYLSKNDEVLGLISVSDTLRDEAKDVINNLKKMNIKTVMLTGDNKYSAEYIGKKLNIDEIYSGVLPNEKHEVVEKLKQNGTIMMVGDGINDSPALATADIGVAVANGSDIAIESADIVLMNSDLNCVLKTAVLSKLTITNIKQNLFWAFLYNSLGIPIAAGVLYPIFGIMLNPMFAGIAMSLSSVCVVSNALRLKTKKLNKVR